MGLSFNITDILSAFVVLFALIDVLGGIPIFLSVQAQGKDLQALKSTMYAFIIMVAFLFVGELVLDLFNVDVQSFAVAGALVIFVMALEMVFGVEIFKYDAPGVTSAYVPVVFPLIAGPGTFTALLSMRAEYAVENIIVGLFLNMVIVFIVLSKLKYVEIKIGAGGVYVMRKFFGIILLAISVRLFTSNLSTLFESFN
ncbi:multiple antibiotic resistance protein [Dysgonomonas sp. PH5-45]|uniref:MarC family protein n=1 Tax=unclassified Dysgonomonas TaxID=2630389 RepID=UPI002475D89D|nr:MULTISPECIES: MarC family protein [unclassified Dysgonomonas]MDH6354368.1 multiple antibiotic resistance protein [Dysgonomonas sp. PH5-45]MDH6387268.1 multiple antibiotic resistance protein [Dysgonomonas sp. PH5-37]